MKKDEYGLHTKYGWVIDHFKPISRGGTNEMKNL